jgi:hypothetical protein
MASLIVLLCLAAPPLLMWWMITVQRRTRERMRERRREEEAGLPPALGYVEEERGADGLSYGRRLEGELLHPQPNRGDLDGIKALEGRR